MTAELFEAMRSAMVVSQLRPNAVTDPRVIDAMGRVPREDFVPAARRSTAYAELLVPMDGAGGINPPMVTGRLLNEAQVEAHDRVLIVGTHTGYIAAVAALLCGSVVCAGPDDAIAGALTGMFDVIIIDGAVEHVPDELLAHLAPDGVLVTGVVEAGVTRLAVGRRGGSGFGLVAFADADMVVFPQFARARSFVF